MISFILGSALGLAFLGYGVFLLLLPRLCNERVKAVFMPENMEMKTMPFFVYRRNGQDVLAYQQNLPAIGAKAPVRGHTYDVYVSSRYPKICITSEQTPVLQYVFSVCLIIVGITIMGLGTAIGFII